MTIIDISLPLSADMPVYPGTDPTTIETVKSASGSNVLSRITMTSHAGTHIDAPKHSLPGASSIDAISLDTFYGPCRVLDLARSQTKITVNDLESFEIQSGERILLKTSNSRRGYESFYDDYVFLSPEGAEYLANLKIRIVGIDSLSIKQRGNPDNTAHTALLSMNIPILEGLNLAEAEAGNYILSAFPLAFIGIDGAPTRAVLITE
jgi:arylformamidase